MSNERIKKADMELLGRVMTSISLETTEGSIIWSQKVKDVYMESYVSQEYNGLVFEITMLKDEFCKDSDEYILAAIKKRYDTEHEDITEDTVIVIDTRNINDFSDKSIIQKDMAKIYGRVKNAVGYDLFSEGQREIINKFLLNSY